MIRLVLIILRNSGSKIVMLADALSRVMCCPLEGVVQLIPLYSIMDKRNPHIFGTVVNVRKFRFRWYHFHYHNIDVLRENAVKRRSLSLNAYKNESNTCLFFKKEAYPGAMSKEHFLKIWQTYIRPKKRYSVPKIRSYTAIFKDCFKCLLRRASGQTREHTKRQSIDGWNHTLRRVKTQVKIKSLAMLPGRRRPTPRSQLDIILIGLL